MRRRDFMSFVGATAVWPLASHPQQLDDYVHNEGHKIVSVALNKFFSAVCRDRRRLRRVEGRIQS
jgi:hypothetical protein